MAVLFSWSYVKRYQMLSGYFLKITPRKRKIKKILRLTHDNFQSNYSTIPKSYNCSDTSTQCMIGVHLLGKQLSKVFPISSVLLYLPA